MLPLRVEQVVADVDAREVDVGSQLPELGFEVPLVSVELVELGVDFLRAVRGREDRHDDQEEQTPQPERRDRPGSEAHG